MTVQIKKIDSLQNEQIKTVVKLATQSKARKEQGKIVLEGIHLLQSLLDENSQPDEVFIHENKIQQPEIQAILQCIPPEKQYCVSNKAFSRISSLTHAADLIAIAAIPEANELPAHFSCVVLENIQDPGNIGTILRSCAAAGIQHILFSQGCADPFNPKVLRAGMGAHFLLNLVQQVDIAEFLQHYSGISLATALRSDTQSLYQQNLCQNVAFIFGNEGAGISEPVQKLTSQCIKIPMIGKTESLNVAMAATICLFERVRQLQNR